MKHGVLSNSIIPVSCTCLHFLNRYMYRDCCAIYFNILWHYIATYCTSVDTLYLSVCFNLNYSWLLNSTAVCSLAAMTNILAPWAQCYMVFKTSSVVKPIKKISGSCCTPKVFWLQIMNPALRLLRFFCIVFMTIKYFPPNFPMLISVLKIIELQYW